MSGENPASTTEYIQHHLQNLVYGKLPEGFERHSDVGGEVLSYRLDEAHDWHLLMGEQIHQVAWGYRDYLYKEAKLDTNQAAIFCISEFISNKANSGFFKKLDTVNVFSLG